MSIVPYSFLCDTQLVIRINSQHKTCPLYHIHFYVIRINSQHKTCPLYHIHFYVIRINSQHKTCPLHHIHFYVIRINYANPLYGVATICHQVHWLCWGHQSLFHIATSLLIWNKMFCVRDIPYRLIWMEFINMSSVYAQSGTHSRFIW